MIYIGTSGWAYPHWKNGVFYPADFKEHDLTYYQKFFNSVELNASFYHLPTEKTFAHWHDLVPKDFVFAVKGPRYITHILRLAEPREPLERLLEAAAELKENRGPIFFQLPPRLGADLKRLASFVKGLPRSQRFAMEFRHPTWFFNRETYQILRENNVALIFSDTPNYPYSEEITADFIYLRLHGHQQLYGSKYTEAELQAWAKKIDRWGRGWGKDVYCYFDNDAQGFAPQNARELRAILDQTSAPEETPLRQPRLWRGQPADGGADLTDAS